MFAGLKAACSPKSVAVVCSFWASKQIPPCNYGSKALCYQPPPCFCHLMCYWLKALRDFDAALLGCELRVPSVLSKCGILLSKHREGQVLDYPLDKTFEGVATELPCASVH